LHFVPVGSHDIVVLNSIHSRPEPGFAALKKTGAAAAIIIPLYANERNLGLLCFASSSRETIAADELDLVTTIAQYLATALDRENTSCELQRATDQLSDHAQLLERRVQERTARLQETISELETFSYTVAHDLRAPARAMSGYCDVLLEDFAENFPPRAKFVLERIARASGRMAALTLDLLEFSKVSRREVVLARVDLEPVIEDLLAISSPAVRDALTVRSPLHAVRGQRDLLLQVLSNLVDNAVKFVVRETPPKITIFTEIVSQHSPNTRLRSLVFSSMENEKAEGVAPASETPLQHVRLWVTDEGIGIPPELHQKIFGIFERASSSEVYDGTGIGLAIVARAMQRMGGTCGVESEPGKGSRFWIELPAA
jgi:signal transduction histidine kinase